MTWSLKYFTVKELECKGSGVCLLAPGFGNALDALREAYGKPMKVNSACRSFKHNAAIGGHPNSAHVYDHPSRELKGSYAVDIHCTDSSERAKLVILALDRGWSVGIQKTFVHFDRRTDYFPELKQAIFPY